MRLIRLICLITIAASVTYAQVPAIEPGVSQELAKWRAAHYSNISYKLNLTLEKMSPVLKGTIEIRVTVSEPPASAGGQNFKANMRPIILDWRRIKGHEDKSTVSKVSLNGNTVTIATSWPPADAGGSDFNDHLIFRDGVKMGENVIKLDFTSPILTSGSAITRYIDKEDGSEYIYSLFVPSDASTAFPLFDQPDLKARFMLDMKAPLDWKVVTNSQFSYGGDIDCEKRKPCGTEHIFGPTKPISTYVFAFAAGQFQTYFFPDAIGKDKLPSTIYVRQSQSKKMDDHIVDVATLNEKAVNYFETYFDYKFPFPKYDLVLIPEFPFGGMEHAGATFLREQSIIFPQEPTKNDVITRANLIFHEAAHQWFGDTVTMKWFDDLWLKEGFATFMAYKALEKIMPEANAWKVFYERVKQAAYQTDSTRGTTAIYQPIANLSSAKSAYGNIVYNKAPAFLRQAEFYLGEDKFQTAVRAFLKKHEFANAGWEDLVKEFEKASGQNLKEWATTWVKTPGVPIFYAGLEDENYAKNNGYNFVIDQDPPENTKRIWPTRTKLITRIVSDGRLDRDSIQTISFGPPLDNDYELAGIVCDHCQSMRAVFMFANYQDYGYGIFLLDDKSRDYVLKNIGREKDEFLRTMMWGSLWDSVREGELDPKEYVELVIKNIGLEKDEGTIQTLLSRVTTAVNYYVADPPKFVETAGRGYPVPPRSTSLRARLEDMLIDKIQNASTQGQRITYYRAFLNIASTDKARGVLKEILTAAKKSVPGNTPMTLKTKDKFDIVTRLAVLGDAGAPKLLADLEKTETSDDAKRYAYAAHAAFATPENKAKFWNDFVNNKDISESWIESAAGPFNSIRHLELTVTYLEKALAILPSLKRERKIFFVNDWLGDFIGGQRDEKALAIINKFLADNPNLDNDLRLKILENSDVIERAVKIRAKYGKN